MSGWKSKKKKKKFHTEVKGSEATTAHDNMILEPRVPENAAEHGNQSQHPIAKTVG